MTRKQRRAAAAAPVFSPEVAFAEGLTPDDFAEMKAMYARVHAREEIIDAPLEAAPIECGAGSPACRPVSGPALPSGPTGPRTPEGKAISSANSLKHGLASGRLVIPGEDREDFEALLNDLVAEHAPATPTEEMLVQQMAQSWWLMHRAIRIQNQAFMETWCDMKKLALFLRYQTTYERAFYRALNSLKKLQKERYKTIREFVSQKRAGARHAAPEFVPHHPQPAPESTRGVGFQPATPAFKPASGRNISAEHGNSL